MKVCRRLLTGTHVSDPFGSVRLCCHLNYIIGKLSENTMEEIWHGEKIKYVFNMLAEGDYSLCNPEGCPFITSGRMDMPLVEIDDIPPHPTHLSLSYEHTCNYRCTVCYLNGEDIYSTVSDAECQLLMDRVEKNLQPALPYLKHISANGGGEVFASKRILRQLSSWKPLYLPEEVSVRLESNGSLFDEQHWKQIENLGQYKLRVDITVMSFDEHTYQTLSGVKYPISRIENNLRFLRSLRKKGVINHLQIATVVQERNFRTLPDFVKRCIDEFEADSVRLRPYRVLFVPTHEIGFFTNIRSKNHPYHKEYLEILKDPIFKHPKVRDWGIFNSQDVESPFNAERRIRNQECKILRQMFTDSSVFEKIETLVQDNGSKIIVHGAGSLGMAIAKNLSERGKIEVSYITDFKQSGDFLGIPIVNLRPPPEIHEQDLPMIITWLQTTQQDLLELRNLGYTGRFIKLDEIFNYK